MTKQKRLYDVLSERELDRVKHGNIPDSLITDVTIGSLMHMSHCLDDKSLCSTEETLNIIMKRGGLI